MAEKFVPSLEVCLPWVSKRGIWDVPGILPGPLGVFKEFVQKRSCDFSFPTRAPSSLPNQFALFFVLVRTLSRQGGRSASGKRGRGKENGSL